MVKFYGSSSGNGPHVYHLPLSQTIILISWALCGKEASRAHGLPTEAPTITEKTPPGIQYH